MASKLELVSLGGIPHCYNRNVASHTPTEKTESMLEVTVPETRLLTKKIVKNF